jgi:hypothetical protein
MRRVIFFLLAVYVGIAAVAAIVLSAVPKHRCTTTYPPPPDPGASAVLGPATTCEVRR